MLKRSKSLEPRLKRPYLVRAIDGLAHAAAIATTGRLGKRPTQSKKVRHIISVPYIDDGSRTHLLDVWIPAPYPGKCPVVIYFHGGGFVIGSKDTHRIAGLQFARRGCLTFVVNYGLAPRHPYPRGLKDACSALAWIWDHLAHYGGDPDRVVLAGESAGGNLATMLTLINSFIRPEPFARAVFDREISLRATIPWCGWYYLTDHAVYEDHPVFKHFAPTLRFLSSLYIRLPAESSDPSAQPLTHPLEILQSNLQPDRPLPPFFIPIGTNDPLYFDSKRLRELLVERDVPVRWKTYRKAHHGFSVMPFMPQFKQVWLDVDDFLDEHGLRVPESTTE